MYANEQGMIDQHVDYLTYVGHTTFPDPYIIQKYGPLVDMDVKIRPISIPDSLLHKMRASLELGYLRFTDESSYNALNLDALFSKIGLQMKMLIINGQLILQTLIMIQILSILCMKPGAWR